MQQFSTVSSTTKFLVPADSFYPATIVLWFLSSLFLGCTGDEQDLVSQKDLRTCEELRTLGVRCDGPHSTKFIESHIAVSVEVRALVEKQIIEKLQQLKVPVILAVNGDGQRVPDIESLAKIRALQALWINSCVIQEADLEGLLAIESLANLSLSECILNVAFERDWKLPPTTQYLSLNNTDNCDKLLSRMEIEPAGKLKSLTIEKCHLTPKSAERFCRATRLKHLALIKTTTDDKILPFIAKLKLLERLCLSDATITDEGFTLLKDLQKIFMLHLDNTKLTDASIDTILGFQELRFIDITGTKIDGAKIRQANKGIDVIE